jgi:hypothetical protein
MDLRSQQRVQPEARPEPVSVAPQQPLGSPQPRRTNNGRRGLGSKRNVILAIVGLLVAVGLVFAFFALQSGLGTVKKDRYQAVFLTNGQVYFGKINKMTDDTFVLNDIYYLQQAADVQKPEDKETSAQNQLTLAKLGKELHGPEDVMYVERSQVLFWENLTKDSEVVKTIEKEKDQAN